MTDITSKEIYELVDKMRSELVAAVQRLDDKFSLMEAGRLTRLEREHAELRASFEPLKKIIYGMVGTILVTVLAAILYLVVK